jgi:hypothetical protein
MIMLRARIYTTTECHDGSLWKFHETIGWQRVIRGQHCYCAAPAHTPPLVDPLYAPRIGDDVVWVAAPLWSGPAGFQRKVLATGERCTLVSEDNGQIVLHCARHRCVKTDASNVRKATQI